MSDPLAGMAPGASEFRGLVRIEEAGPQAMITLRGDLSLPALARALEQVAGLPVPGRRAVVSDGPRTLAWMSPDEMLLILPVNQRDKALATLGRAAEGAFLTFAEMSDARAAFLLRGVAWREVLAKLCPVDLHPETFGAGQIRRTRAAQASVAFWISGEDEATLVCFRSVASYVSGLLANAARPGSGAALYAEGGARSGG